MHALLVVPMLAIAGAAAFFVRGWLGEAVRGAAAGVGLALVILFKSIVQADLTLQLEDFGRERGIVWLVRKLTVPSPSGSSGSQGGE